MVCVIVIAIFFRRDSKILKPRLVLVAFIVLFVLFGVLRFNLTHTRFHILQKFAEASSQIKDSSGKHKIIIKLIGYISNEPEINKDKQRLTLESKTIEIGNRRLDTSEKVLIITRLYPEYRYGQAVEVNGELLLPKNFNDADGNNFDYVAYLAKDGVNTLMNYPEIKLAVIELPFYEQWKISVYNRVFQIKKLFADSINRSLAEPNASFINGILLGSRSQIPDEIKTAFARTSTSHILAISGYNITIIAGIISWFFLLFFRRPVAFWFSLTGVILFTIMTGAQASVVRASVMGILILIALREGRLYGAKNAIIFAGTIMILINPEILRYDVGFQLSFAATLGLIFFSPILEKYFEKLPALFNFRETLTMTLSAQILVLPLLLFYFRNLSLVAVPANILVLPMIPYTMAIGFATGLIGWLPIVGGFLSQLIGYFVWLLSSLELKIIELLARPNWAAIDIQFSWYLVVLAYFLIILVLIKYRKHVSSK